MSVKRSAPLATGGLVMTAGSFLWNGNEVAVPSVTELERIFGAPDRVSKMQPNSILTWDSLGLYGYIENKTKQVISMAVSLRAFEDGRPFRPTSAFAGAIATPWISITAATTQADLVAAGFKADFGTHYSRIEATAGFFAEFLEQDLVDLQLCRNE